MFKIELCEDVLILGKRDATDTLIRQDLDGSTTLAKRPMDQRAEGIHVLYTPKMVTLRKSLLGRLVSFRNFRQTFQ